MRRTLTSALVAGALVAGVVALNPVAAGAVEDVTYRVDVLLNLPGSDSSEARDINDAGQIVGDAIVGSSGTAVLWSSRSSVPTLLPAGGFGATSAFDINNDGEIVGRGLSGFSPVALYWASPTSTPVALLNGSFLFPEAHGINDSGEIVGEASTGFAGVAAYWSSPTASPTALPDGGLGGVTARGINDAGNIVGQLNSIPTLPLFWENPTASPTVLPTGTSLLWRPLAINDDGEIVGIAVFPDTGLVAAIAPSPGAPPFFIPPSGVNARASGVNNAGLVVGGLAPFFTSVQPLIWTPEVVSTLFLHAHGATLSLDSISPTNSAAAFRDSAAVKFAGGNPWKEIGTWNQPPVGQGRTLTGLGNLEVWLGLKNSDDQGTRFDVRAELLRNGVPIATGSTACETGLTRNPPGGRLVFVPFGAISNATLGPADVLAVRVSARIGTNESGGLCGGHSNAVGLRLYFDGVNSSSGLEIGRSPQT